MTQCFVSAKRLIRYFSNSSKRVEHRAQSPVREIKMLAVWPSIAEGFPTACSIWPRRNAASYQPRNFNSSQVFDNFLLHIIREHALGNPSAIKGQTANILISRTGLWVRCSTSLLEFEKYLMSLLAERKRRVIPATKFQFLISLIFKFFIFPTFHLNGIFGNSWENSIGTVHPGGIFSEKKGNTVRGVPFSLDFTDVLFHLA